MSILKNVPNILKQYVNTKQLIAKSITVFKQNTVLILKWSPVEIKVPIKIFKYLKGIKKEKNLRKKDEFR